MGRKDWKPLEILYTEKQNTKVVIPTRDFFPGINSVEWPYLTDQPCSTLAKSALPPLFAISGWCRPVIVFTLDPPCGIYSCLWRLHVLLNPSTLSKSDASITSPWLFSVYVVVCLTRCFLFKCPKQTHLWKI